MALTSPFVIELTEAERMELERCASSRIASFARVQRATAIPPPARTSARAS
jgi:hypothetical protein